MPANSPVILTVLKCVKFIIESVITLIEKGVNN